MNDKIIPITCTASHFIEVESLIPLQGRLKDKTREQLNKLKRQILKYGFSFPIFVWHNDGKNYTLDGHGRDFIAKELIAEGYLFSRNGSKPSTKIPADFIEAKNKVEAKEKLLALNSSYGIITVEGLYEYLNERDAQLNLDSLKMDIELPNISTELFEQFWINKESIDKFFTANPGSSSQERKKNCPNCGFEL
jgi:hypothetical protein